MRNWERSVLRGDSETGVSKRAQDRNELDPGASQKEGWTGRVEGQEASIRRGQTRQGLLSCSILLPWKFSGEFRARHVISFGFTTRTTRLGQAQAGSRKQRHEVAGTAQTGGPSSSGWGAGSADGVGRSRQFRSLCLSGMWQCCERKTRNGRRFLSHLNLNTNNTQKKKKTKSLSHVQLFMTPWTIARLLCPRDFPGKNTGWVAISSSRGSS